MFSAVFILFAFFLKADRRDAALLLGVCNLAFYFVADYIVSDFNYYMIASLADAAMAYVLASFRTLTSIRLAYLSLASCVVNGLGYLLYLSYSTPLAYTVSINIILVTQMLVLLGAGLRDGNSNKRNNDDCLGSRGGLLVAHKDNEVRS